MSPDEVHAVKGMRGRPSEVVSQPGEPYDRMLFYRGEQDDGGAPSPLSLVVAIGAPFSLIFWGVVIWKIWSALH